VPQSESQPEFAAGFGCVPLHYLPDGSRSCPAAPARLDFQHCDEPRIVRPVDHGPRHAPPQTQPESGGTKAEEPRVHSQAGPGCVPAGWSGGQPSAALEAARLQDCPTGGGGHACTEPVLLGSAAVVGLKGALHRMSLSGRSHRSTPVHKRRSQGGTRIPMEHSTRSEHAPESSGEEPDNATRSTPSRFPPDQLDHQRPECTTSPRVVGSSLPSVACDVPIHRGPHDAAKRTTEASPEQHPSITQGNTRAASRHQRGINAAITKVHVTYCSPSNEVFHSCGPICA
jgi:hypothetical protein